MRGTFFHFENFLLSLSVFLFLSLSLGLRDTHCESVSKNDEEVEKRSIQGADEKVRTKEAENGRREMRSREIFWEKVCDRSCFGYK